MQRLINVDTLEDKIQMSRYALQLMDDTQKADLIMTGLNIVDNHIKSMNIVEAQPVKQGKWEKYYFDHVAMGERPFMYYCSFCSNMTPYLTNYCPHCGVRMRKR